MSKNGRMAFLNFWLRNWAREKKPRIGKCS